MDVRKRNGSTESVNLSKITNRLKSLRLLEPELKNIDEIVDAGDERETKPVQIKNLRKKRHQAVVQAMTQAPKRRQACDQRKGEKVPRLGKFGFWIGHESSPENCGDGRREAIKERLQHRGKDGVFAYKYNGM